MRSLERVLLQLLAVCCTIATAYDTFYQIQGHYSGVALNSVLGVEKARGAFLPEETKIANRLSTILGDNYENFFVDYFEIHGYDAGYPTTIYFGYLSTKGQMARDDIAKAILANDDMNLYFLMAVDKVPPPPSLDVKAAVNSCNNGGILLPNQTCACPPYTFGDQCEKMDCRHMGIQDQGRCACPPGSYALHCEPRSCMTAVQANLDTSFQSLILVISLKDTMAYDMQLLVSFLPILIDDFDSASPDLVQNFIVTAFRQFKDTYYMSTAFFTGKSELLAYIKNLQLSQGDQDQPILAALVAAQAYHPLMRPRSNVLVFADSAVSDSQPSSTYLSNKNNETIVIARTLQWKNRITFILTEGMGAVADYYGDYFDTFRRVARAVHGDVLIVNKMDLNNTLYWMIAYYYQMENIHALYNVSGTIALAVDSDYQTETVYLLATVEGNDTLPVVSNAQGAPLLPQWNATRVAIYRLQNSVTASVSINAANKVNLRMFINSAYSAWVAYHDDPAVDVGDAFSWINIVQTATGYTTWPNATGIQFYLAPSNDEKNPIGQTNSGVPRGNGSCTFPYTFNPLVNQCLQGTPGPYIQLVTINVGSTQYMRALPGYCFTADPQPPTIWKCLNNGTLQGQNTCRCNSTFWGGPHCEIPVCQNGGRPNEFPGNGRPLCLCQFGFSGDFCQTLSCDTPAPDVFQSYNRTLAVVIQDTWQMAVNGRQINLGLQALIRGLNNYDIFADYVLTTFRMRDDIGDNGTLTPAVLSSKYSDADSFLNATAAIGYVGSPDVPQPSLLALDITMRAIDYDKGSILLFTSAASSSIEDDPNYLDIVLIAVERQIEINVVILPPYNAPEMCIGGENFQVLVDLVQQAGGNVLNLCNQYSNNSINVNPVIDFLTSYGESHHHLETVAYKYSASCADTLQFSIEDVKTKNSQSFLFINSPNVETFSLAITDLDTNTNLTITDANKLSRTPFMTIYDISRILTQTNQNGFLAYVQGTGQYAGPCSIKVGLRSQLGVYVGFSPDPSRDKALSTLVYGATINPVIHVSSALQSPATVMAIATDDTGSVIYNQTAVQRSPTCHFENYFMTPMACTKSFMSETVTVKLVTNELTVQRAVRGFCSLQSTRCYHGGTYNNNTQACDCRPGFQGTVCENVQCINGGTQAYFRCYCPDDFAGERCEFQRCYDYNWLEAQDARAQNFQQITFVVEVTHAMVQTNLYLSQFTLQQFLDNSDDMNNPKQYSLVTFDNKNAQVVVSTSHKDVFMYYAQKALFQQGVDIVTDTTVIYTAVKKALDITIQYPHQIHLFTATTKSDQTDFTVGTRQNFGAQINAYYSSGASAPAIPTSDYQIPLIVRQSGGRIWPFNPNKMQIIETNRAWSQTVMENGLIYDNGWADCTSQQNAYFDIETTGASKLVLNIQGQGLLNSGAVYVYRPGNTMVTTQAPIFSDENALSIISIDLSSIIMMSGKSTTWRVAVKTSQGACFVQARVISNLHIIPGFTTDRRMDWVSPNPFFGLGANNSAYMTARVTNSSGDNYGITINSVDLYITDVTAPWQTNSSFGSIPFTQRDPLSCGNQWISDLITLTKDKYWKFIVRGMDRAGYNFMRIFYIVGPDNGAKSIRCINGDYNDYGECVCTNTSYFGADCSFRFCLNGGVSSNGICDCLDGYYGQFCEKNVPGYTTTVISSPGTSVSPGSTVSPPASTNSPQPGATTTAAPPGTTALPGTTATSPTPGSTISHSCAWKFTNYYIFHMVDGSGVTDTTVDATQELVSTLSLNTNLDLGGTGQNTRYMLGLMGQDFTGYPNNVSQVQDIASAFNSLNGRLPSSPGLINYTAALTSMANNAVYNRYDQTTENPPFIILYPGVQNIYGLDNLKAGVQALINAQFRVLAINMNPGVQPLTDDLNNAIGALNVFAYTNPTETVSFIMNRLCVYKPT